MAQHISVVSLSPRELVFMQDTVSAQVQAFYDDPIGVLDDEYKCEDDAANARRHLRLLKSLARKFDLDWDVILQQEGVTDYQKKVIAGIIE